MRTTAIKYFVDSAGNYLGAFSGFQREDAPIWGKDTEVLGDDGTVQVIPGKIIGHTPGEVIEPRPTDPQAVEVPGPPSHGLDRWDGTQWVPHVAPRRDLDQAITDMDPLLRAVIELVPGGIEAVKAKVGTMRGL